MHEGTGSNRGSAIGKSLSSPRSRYRSERNLVLHRDRGNQTIRCRGRHPVSSETPSQVPHSVPPLRVEREPGHRRKPLEKTGGLLGLDQSRHQFKKNPLGDGRLSIDDQGFESGLNLGIPRRTKCMDPDGGVNEIQGRIACVAESGAGQASDREGSCPASSGLVAKAADRSQSWFS